MIDPAALSRLFDPAALALVAGGSVAVAALHGTGADLRAALAALRQTCRRRFDEDQARAEIARLERIARRAGMLAIEGEPVSDPVLAAAVRQVVDGAWPEQVAALFAAARAERQARLAVPQRFWCTVADVAPAMGMIGTVIGLIGMFAAMNDVAAIGPSMGLALLTTLYGAVLSNLLAAPIAARIGRHAETEDEARARVEPFVVALAALDRTAPRRVELAA